MRIAIAAAITCLSIIGVTATAQVQAAIRKHTEIPAEPLDLALRTLAKDRGFQLIFLTENVAALQTRGAVGDYTVDEALKKLLSDSRLDYKFVDDNTVSIFPKPNPTSALENRDGERARGSNEKSSGGSPKNSPEKQFRVAQVDQGKATSDVPAEKLNEKTENKKAEGLEEIVVTGTHIRGATDPVSPVQVYTREQIDRSGAGSVAEFLRRLPQNFGDVSENTMDGVAGTSQSQNAVGGSGVDLRGLGSDATLVLIDGRRIAPGNFLGNFADVSMIPLSAIERIEVITDGASAIYGSDAVGGVINFILRRDFNGAETRVRYGTVNDGGHRELSAAQTVGRMWDGGSGLISYEYSDGTPLSAADRSYSMTATQPFNLLPEQVRNSAIFTVDQTISSGTAAFASGSFSHRSTYADASLVGAFAQHNPADISSYGGTMGLRMDVFRQSQLEVSGTYAASDTKLQTVEVPSEVLDFGSKTFATTSSFDAKLDGTLWTTAAGAIRYAVGGQARHETFDFDQTVPDPFAINASRNIAAEYVELRIPIVAPRHPGTSEYRLELSLADRNEHYSDFG
jgi:iron complex outermembrane receptor protein